VIYVLKPLDKDIKTEKVVKISRLSIHLIAFFDAETSA
jgi:hypothetical protein